MKILIFNPKFVETAYHLSARTGLDVVNGDWSPEKDMTYIVFGAEYQMRVLCQSANQHNLSYIIMNTVCPDNLPDQYKELIKDNTVICENITWPKKFNDLGISSEYGIFESFKPKERTRDTDFLLWSGSGLIVPKGFKVFYLHRDKTYTVEQFDKIISAAKVYVHTRKDDWYNIHKAISSGAKVLSCHQDPDMEVMYEPYVCFADDIDLSKEYHLPEQDYEKFLKTVATFSLNKMLPIIKDAYIKINGHKKEEKVTITYGTDSDGKEVVDVAPSEKEDEPTSRI